MRWQQRTDAEAAGNDRRHEPDDCTGGNNQRRPRRDDRGARGHNRRLGGDCRSRTDHSGRRRLLGRGDDSPRSTAKKGGTLIFGSQADAETLDPHITTALLRHALPRNSCTIT